MQVPPDLAPHLPAALEDLNVACFVLDDGGRIRWLNATARAIVGDVVGQLFTSVVDPEEARGARMTFARRLRGEERGDFAIDLIAADGSEVQVEISSIPLKERHRAIGMFGIAIPIAESRTRPPKLDGRLTPRQHEVVQLLGEGASTEQIASRLSLSRETVRNHIRHILTRLDASSRLEAVAIARRDGLI